MKRNEFLDASDSEDGAENNSDDELTKGGARPAKRRKVEVHRDEAESESEGEASDEKHASTEQDASKDEKKKSLKVKPTTKLPDITRPMRKNLVVTDKAIKKSGVVFISRVPPFMKPAKMRSLLEPYGAINRMFLSPEDATSRKRRIRAGGNKKPLYTEGWVEFVRKKDAKAVCELLNAQIIGGKKRSYYHDDIWNLVYLKGFKWHHLTQQIAAENAERTSRMRAEISKATKENKEFVRNVERAKMLDGIHAKKKNKGGEARADEPAPERTRTFRQFSLVKKPADDDEQPEHVTRVLGKIF
ncbi:Pre-rRNA-processing protein ESF2 [Ophiocordyceps camponoti-floridani]|uniref:18S rRNA factor 2 n=1 Tax=Ophiocordyceps camponoti-floridani TaxID=2030778 RepID=A0A8H4VD79_9HYPO|nr:Pre-rRNA-processing protein ESF2 [Ophiocordyceps camponoti-floridani]